MTTLNQDNKKYFVFSDVHSFATELKQSLKRAGFDKKNPNHIIIVCGDIFDRGSEAIKVYNFLKSIPKYRRVLVRGNHELLYMALLKKKYPQDHDFSNRTADTFCQIADMEYLDKDKTSPTVDYLRAGYYYSSGFTEYESITPECQEWWNIIKEKVAKHPITKWLQSKEWKYYYEVENCVFVHSFIPTRIKKEILDKYGSMAYMFENPEAFEFNPEWRESPNYRWEEATWGCPFEQYTKGLFKLEEEAGKTLVCGHWHTADFFKHLKNRRDHDGEIYFSKGLIGIDGGVFYNPFTKEYVHPQNVLVIENGKFYNEYGAELQEVTPGRIIRTVTVDKDGNEIPGSDDFLN